MIEEKTIAFLCQWYVESFLYILSEHLNNYCKEYVMFGRKY